MWGSIVESSRGLLEGRVGDILGLVYSPHMAGVVPVDDEGKPLRNIMIWLDERGAGLPRELWGGFPRVKGYNLFRLIEFLRITGGAPSATGKDPLSKIVWLRENEPDVFRRARRFLDVKAFLIFRSTGSYVTSPDEANLTWLCDTRGGVARWSGALMRRYGLRDELFPVIRESIEVAGRLSSDAARELGLEAGVPVFVGAGDLTAAAVGSGAVGFGEIHLYVGTSDWIAAHIRERRVDVFHYVGSILSAIPRRYLLVAEQEVAAGSLEWAMGVMGISDYGVVNELVSSTEPGSGGVLFMPWMYGERSPIDDPHARGGFINLTLRHSRGELLRAIMEGVALNMRWSYPYVERITGYNGEVRIIGGGALFDVWCQIIADTIGRRVLRVSNPRVAGLRGSAMIAAVGLGLYSSFEEARGKVGVDRVFEPDPRNRAIYEGLFRRLREAYRRLRPIMA